MLLGMIWLVLLAWQIMLFEKHFFVAAGNVLLVKGAAECVLERCDRMMLPDGKVVKLTPAARSAVLATVDNMADHALRILAMAYK